MRLLLALFALLLTFGAPALAQEAAKAPAVSQEGVDLVLDNPAASVTFDEYLSYTCPHCAHFNAEAGPAIEDMAAKGVLRVRLIPAVRDPLDIAEAMLVRCAAPAHALTLHHAFFAGHEDLYNAARRVPAFYTDMATAKSDDIAAVAEAAGLADIAKTGGIDAAAYTACLGDQQALSTLQSSAMDSWKKIEGTPSFAINGTLLDANDWPTVQKRLEAALSR